MRPGDAEIPQDLLLGVAPFLVADPRASLAVEARQPGYDGRIVQERAVAVQLLEGRDQHGHVLERVGPLRMARNLRHLPGSEIAVDLLRKHLAALGKALDLLRDVDRRVVLREAQFFDAVLELRDGLLELEEGSFHGVSILPGPGRASATGTRWPPSATAAMSLPASSFFSTKSL